MAEFNPITTQEQLDSIIGERLKRDRESQQTKLTEKYGNLDDLLSENASLKEQVTNLGNSIKEYTEKAAGYDQTIANLQAQAKKYAAEAVKTRIANEYGIPFGLADRLAGETEEDIRKDAEMFSKLTASQKQAPMKSTEKHMDDNNSAALRNLLHSMKGE